MDNRQREEAVREAIYKLLKESGPMFMEEIVAHLHEPGELSDVADVDVGYALGVQVTNESVIHRADGRYDAVSYG